MEDEMSKLAPRNVHFVGTLPEKDSRAAMKLMLKEAGPYLASMPDGETGRLDYVTDLVIGLRNHPAITHVLPNAHPGLLRNFFDLPFYTLKNPKELTPDSLHLGYADEALASWPIFKKEKAAAVKAGKASADLRFQVGIPGDLQLPFMAFKASGFKDSHRLPFMEATAEEIRKIHKATKGQVVFQLELPSENVLTTYAPRFKRAEVADRFARGVRRLLLALPKDVHVGIHACNIDMNKKSLLPFVSPHATVTLANALVKHWPKDRAPMEFFHFPWARGDRKPRFSASLVEELKNLKLPAETKLIIGMSHDLQTQEEQEAGLRAIEKVVGHPVGVGATCGLGRLRGKPTSYDKKTGKPTSYNIDRVLANIRRTVELTQTSVD